MTALAGVAPSILSADFARLGAQVSEVLDAGASVIHIDVMDGHFVPPLTMGPMVVSALRELAGEAGALLDVHLMVERPERHVADFAAAGADVITLHAEATAHAHYALKAVRDAGCRAGLALNPGTSVDVIAPLLGLFDMALCMTVNPGWGGQAFIPASPGKVRRLRALIGPDVALEVDGGIAATSAASCSEAGASVFVAGSAIFGRPDPAAAVRELAAAIAAV